MVQRNFADESQPQEMFDDLMIHPLIKFHDLLYMYNVQLLTAKEKTRSFQFLQCLFKIFCYFRVCGVVESVFLNSF